ncbi:hypothetical protein OKJ48_22385 [Streptomyces kunmingensis]|uniref:Uncharacterized protein n=1 Tax=Streptomyces kunmingensis TaxID=68225 RepID=A0ABU6CET3_9ACTN|nr:hypothetical protein [Streptomyces kunmingensis]MEB3962974.1 hypothetical protein [Streptomyces kunmingensis]
MPSARRTLTANAVANAAGVDSNWVYRAVENGILPATHFEADIIVIKLHRLLSGITWPDKPRQRSRKHAVDTWQLTALNAARDAVTDPFTTAETTLWVTQNQVLVANTRLERAALEATDTHGTSAAPLDGQLAFRFPIGRWIDDLPSVLAQTPTREPRRKKPAVQRSPDRA